MSVNEILYSEKKLHIVIKIFRFLCFSKSLNFKIYDVIIYENTFFVVSLECYWISRWNLVKYLYNFSKLFLVQFWSLVSGPFMISKERSYNEVISFLVVYGYQFQSLVCTTSKERKTHHHNRFLSNYNWLET